MIWIMTCSDKNNLGHTEVSVQASLCILKADFSVYPPSPDENHLPSSSVCPPRLYHTNKHSFCHDNHLLLHQLTQRLLGPASNRSGTGRWVCSTMVQHACDVCAPHAAPPPPPKLAGSSYKHTQVELTKTHSEVFGLYCKVFAVIWEGHHLDHRWNHSWSLGWALTG